MDPSNLRLTPLGYFKPSASLAALAFIASFPGNGGKVCFEIAACPISFAHIVYFNEKTFAEVVRRRGAPSDSLPNMTTEEMSGALRAWVRLTQTTRKPRRR